jgi:hypothetical protein
MSGLATNIVSAQITNAATTLRRFEVSFTAVTTTSAALTATVSTGWKLLTKAKVHAVVQYPSMNGCRISVSVSMVATTDSATHPETIEPRECLEADCHRNISPSAATA